MLDEALVRTVGSACIKLCYGRFLSSRSQARSARLERLMYWAARSNLNAVNCRLYHLSTARFCPASFETNYALMPTSSRRLENGTMTYQVSHVPSFSATGIVDLN